MIRRFASLMLPRFLRFRKEVVMLAKAFVAPQTPLYLKVATLFAVFYLISPIDLIPDVIPVVGWIDDLIIVPLIVGWIVSRLPRPVPATVRSEGTIIEGTARADI